jgi:3-dehydroquinate dehydratase-1
MPNVGRDRVDAIVAIASSPPGENPTMTIVMIQGPDSTDGACAGAVQSALEQRAREAGQELRRYRCASDAQLLDRLSSIDRGEADIILFDAGRAAPAAPLRQALDGLAVPYIEVNDAGVDTPDAALPARGPRIALVQGYAAQGYTLALSLALERLGCADRGNDFNVGT